MAGRGEGLPAIVASPSRALFWTSSAGTGGNVCQCYWAELLEDFGEAFVQVSGYGFQVNRLEEG